MLDVRTAQDQLEDLLRDTILFALGKRWASVASVSALRALTTMAPSGTTMHDDMLAAITSGGATTGWRWNGQSTATDDGMTTIKPNDVPANGRWINYVSPLRVVLTPGANSMYLHEVTSGPLQRVVVLDRNMEDAEVSKLIFGQVPSVVIETTDDTPVDMTEDTGWKWNTMFHFTVSTIAQNLRDRRQAAQGSTFAGEDPLGANGIDGLVQSLLGGTQVNLVEGGVRNVAVGRGYNWMSEQAQRRVIRGRAFTILATVINPPAPNDAGPIQEIDTQAEMTSLGDDTTDPWPGDMYVTSGLTVSLGVGLSKTIAAGTAVMNGNVVTYAGALETFAASSLTYRDLNPDGTLTLVAGYDGQDPPPVTVNALRVGVTQTNGSAVIGDRLIAPSSETYGSLNQNVF